MAFGRNDYDEVRGEAGVQTKALTDGAARVRPPPDTHREISRDVCRDLKSRAMELIIWKVGSWSH